MSTPTYPGPDTFPGPSTFPGRRPPVHRQVRVHKLQPVAARTVARTQLAMGTRGQTAVPWRGDTDPYPTTATPWRWAINTTERPGARVLTGFGAGLFGEDRDRVIFRIDGATPNAGFRTVVGPHLGQGLTPDTTYWHVIRLRARYGFVGSTATLRVARLDGANGRVDFGSSTPIVLPSSWSWVAVPFTTPATHTLDTPYLELSLDPAIGPDVDGDPPSLDIVEWGLVQGIPEDQGVDPSVDCFDGDAPNARGLTYTWAGTPGASMAYGHTYLGQDVTADLQAAQVDRGGDDTAALLALEVGTATMTFKGVPDLGPQDRVALVEHTRGEHLFTGQVVGVNRTSRWEPGRGRMARTTVVRAADPGRVLGNTTRYSVASSSDEDTPTRLARLMGSAPGVEWRYAPGGTTTQNWKHRPYVREGKLSDHLQMVANTVLAGAAVDRDGAVLIASPIFQNTTATNAPPPTTPVVFTDGSGLADPAQVDAPYVALSEGYGTDRAPNQIELTDYGRKLEDGAYVQALRYWSGAYAPGVAEHGPRGEALDVATSDASRDPFNGVLDPPHGQLVADVLARVRRPRERVTGVRLNPGLYGLPPGVDLLHLAHVVLDGTYQTAYVAGISHTITPTTWTTDYRLAEPGQDTTRTTT